MKNRWLGVALMALSAAAGAASEFLDVDAAFRLGAAAAADGKLALSFDIAPGYHLYRERLSFSGAKAGDVAMPTGRMVHDANFDRDMEIYEGRVALGVPLQGAGEGVLTVGYQGCAEAGLCYPPQMRSVRVTFGQPNVVVGAAVGRPVAAGGHGPPYDAPTATPTAALRSGNLFTVVGMFLLAGVLLSFTPCVLPMVPILSAIIVGDRAQKTRARGFSLALSYSLGMALVYTAFGIAAGLVGEGLAAWLQNPWVLGAFALAMAGLALSMFDVYQLQMPSFIQSRLTQASGNLRGGNYAAVFAMGGVSALIVGPCVAAPLAGALVYISQTRDVALGGAALFALASGMSVPLLLVGVSAGALLPKAGRWMESVKKVMGVAMLAVAAWIVSPVLPWPGSHGAGFHRVDSPEQLDAAIAQAGGKTVMVDVYADWCVACKELEHETFADAAVRARLDGMVLLQADVTANTGPQRTLLKRYGLFGPPGVLFFDASGRELAGHRVIGFEKPDAFLADLAAVSECVAANNQAARAALC